MAIASSPAFVLDCPDPDVLAQFYAELLGWQVRGGGDWAEIWSADRSGCISFQQVENFQPPQWPGQSLPQQIHLDLNVDDLDEGERAAVALGATRAEVQPGTKFRVFLDPAGHPFCLCVH